MAQAQAPCLCRSEPMPARALPVSQARRRHAVLRVGLTQAQLADRAGLTKDGVAHLEQGPREPGFFRF
jgi:predicted transcriptional regulator